MNGYLIVRLGSLGDVIHGIPTAAALKAEFPNARVDWMVDPRYVELLNLVTCIDRKIPMDPRGLFSRDGRYRATLRELRSMHYDAVIDLQGLLKSAVLARLVNGRTTIGFPREHLREPAARFFYTRTPSPGRVPHVVHKNLALLAPLKVADRRLRFPIEIPRTPTVDAVVDRFGGYALINPGAAWPNKQWPPERFGAVAAGLFEELGMRSIVLWGPGEQPLAQQVVAASAGTAEASPPTTITDLFGLAKGAQLMISGDTGPLHIACAVGTPIVALFGPTFAERNGPWGLFDVAVSRADQCQCHYRRKCTRATRCIDDIEVSEVLDAVRRRMGLNEPG